MELKVALAFSASQTPEAMNYRAWLLSCSERPGKNRTNYFMLSWIISPHAHHRKVASSKRELISLLQDSKSPRKDSYGCFISLRSSRPRQWVWVFGDFPTSRFHPIPSHFMTQPEVWLSLTLDKPLSVLPDSVCKKINFLMSFQFLLKYNFYSETCQLPPF